MVYQAVKHFHMLTVMVSFSLFCFRFVLMLKESSWLNKKWLKITPHANDTLLLASGVYLIYLTRFVPFTSAAPWLTEKLLCVLAYIILGFFALKFGRNKWMRTGAFVAAFGWIAMAGYLAVSKLPIFI